MDKPLQEASFFRRISSTIGRYADHPDPIVRACNILALVVASNQPFYPLYIWWLVGDDRWVSLLTLLSTPFFIAIPAIARKSRAAGLAALPFVGLVNTIIATKALGVPAGIELFAIPCVLIAILATDRDAGLAIWGATLTVLIVYVLFYLSDPSALHVFSADEFVRLYRLNMFSVAGLTIYAILALGFAHKALRSRSPD